MISPKWKSMHVKSEKRLCRVFRLHTPMQQESPRLICQIRYLISDSQYSGTRGQRVDYEMLMHIYF